MVNHGTPGVRRRDVLAGAILGAAAATGSTLPRPSRAAAAEPATSPAPTALPAPLAKVVEAWAQNPASHPYLGDWRRVGYRRGTAEPGASNPRIVRASSEGILPGHDADVSGPLQAALDKLGASGGGVLALDAGRYVLDKPLFIHHSHVVLRGAGTGETTLFFARPLQEGIGPAPNNASSSWSWTGGQVFFLAPERLAASKAVNWDTRSEGWLPGATLATVAPAARGTDVLLVDDSSKLKPGEMMLLEVDNVADQRLLREMAGNIAGADTYPWEVRARPIAFPAAYADLNPWRWPVIVTDVVSPRTVRIEQPLRIQIHRETPARLREIGPTLHDSGVEELTIENKLIPQTAHNQNPGSNGVCFQAVHDCWARNIRVLNADVAFAMTTAKSCTLAGISAGGRSLHHFVACRVSAHDNLVEDFVLENFTVPAVTGALLHGINLEGLSSGNVFRRGTMHTGTFDSHRQLPFENLRTNITITNKDAVVGGGLDAGPYFGARTVHWGITVTNGNNLAIEISDVAPRSLSAGIHGLSKPGSGGMNNAVVGGAYTGDLESELLAFGTDLTAEARDLLEIQRAAAPLPAGAA